MRQKSGSNFNKFTFLVPVVSAVLIFNFTEVRAAQYYRTADIKVFDVDSSSVNQQSSWLAYPKEFTGGASVAVGDVNSDGFQEIITAAGPSGGPHIKVFTAKGVLLSQFLAFDKNFKKGLVVTAGDVLGDGNEEIIVATRPGGSPHVRIFDQSGNFLADFFAFEKKFRGGVLLAAGDVTGDDKEEIITAAGPSGGPHVRVFNGAGEWIGIDFSPFAAENHGGVSLAAADVDGGDGKDEIIMAVHSSGESWVKVYKADQEKTVLGQWRAYPSTFQGGVNIVAADFDDDGLAEVVTAPNIGGGPHLRFFEIDGTELDLATFPYESDFRGGVWLAAGEADGDGRTELITAPGKKFAEGRTDLHKYIEVDLSDQRLQAYENGYEKFDFLISSGTKKYPTPEGDFKVWRRRASVRMTWIYGPDHPDNYDLENVPHVLSFSGAYALHGAYWHNNFGHVMSHGCINEPLDKAELVYNWAEVGTPVIVHK